MMNWVTSSSLLILVVTLLRRVLRGRISLRFQYGLWALVLIRLLCPVNLLSSPMSLENYTKNQPVTQFVQAAVEVEVPKQSYRSAREDLIESYIQQGEDPYAMEQEDPERFSYQVMDRMDSDLSIKEILTAVWLAGVAAMLAVVTASNLHFRKKLLASRWEFETARTALPVYVSNQVPTPCLCGVFCPVIYLTPEVAEDPAMCNHVLEHELTHYRHWDNVIAVLRCLALCIHWFNPLVWSAARTSRQDGELACDEATLLRLGEEQRGAYGRTLISLTCQGSDIMLTATTMTGSTSSIKERILLIARKPKMAAITLVLALAVTFAAVGCTFTGATGDTELRQRGQEYLDDVDFSMHKNEDVAPYVTLFLPEDIPMEGLTLELKWIRDNGAEQILYDQDSVQPGEEYVINDLSHVLSHGELELKMAYIVDGETVAQRSRTFKHDDMVVWLTADTLEPDIPESVMNQMSDYAGDYFSAKMEKHNNQLFLPESEEYNGVSYSTPQWIETEIASGHNLYLYKVDARYPRADEEKIRDKVYILVHLSGNDWEFVTLATQEELESYDTPQMEEKYSGTHYDAAAMELYLKHKDDALVMKAEVQIKMVSDGSFPALAQLERITYNLIYTTMTKDYPNRSLDVHVTDMRLMELNPLDPELQLCYLSFHPTLPDGGRGMDYRLYLVVKEDTGGTPYFIRTYEAEGYADDADAKNQIWHSMLYDIQLPETGDEAFSRMLFAVMDSFEPVTLVLNGSDLALEGRKVAGESDYAVELGKAAYELWDGDAELTGNHVLLALTDSSNCITYYETGYALVEEGGKSRIFRTDGYEAARMWYDVAEYMGILSAQPNLVVEYRGQTPETAAQEACQAMEELSYRLSDGNCYKNSYVNCTVVLDEDQTATLRGEGSIEANAWCFVETIVLVPENERAERIAWETPGIQVYQGDDSSVPEGALQYTRYGFITLTDTDWICSLVGTSW